MAFANGKPKPVYSLLPSAQCLHSGGTASTAQFVSHMQPSEDSPQAGVHQHPCSSARKTTSQKNSVIPETTYGVTNDKCNSLGLFVTLLF